MVSNKDEVELDELKNSRIVQKLLKKVNTVHLSFSLRDLQMITRVQLRSCYALLAAEPLRKHLLEKSKTVKFCTVNYSSTDKIRPNEGSGKDNLLIKPLQKWRAMACEGTIID